MNVGTRCFSRSIVPVMEAGLVFAVPELEPVLDRWRIATVESAAAGGPAHVTALFPWSEAPVSRQHLTELAEHLRQFGPVTLTFNRLDRFDKGVLFLALSDSAESQMRLLTRALVDAFPEFIPYGGEHPDPHPHLTVACGAHEELDEIEPQVAQALAPLLPYTVLRTEVVVMEQQPDGRWVQAHRVPLGSAPAS